MVTKMGELGWQFAKPDLERIGLFSEMPYMNGKGYVSPFLKPLTQKGRNIMGEGPKTKTGKQDCYFDKEFKRIFSGEAIKGRGKKPPPSKYKNISEKPFIATDNLKPISTPGGHWGTFDRNVEAFSNKKKPQPPAKKEPRNILTNLGKKGGCGYVNICLNPYPSHDNDRYGVKPKYKEYGRNLGGPMITVHFPKPVFDENPFKDPPNVKPGPTYVRPQERLTSLLPPGKIIPTGPAKLPGGCHAGCFDKFPEYKPTKYITIQDLNKTKRETGGKFLPQSTAEKSFYTTSIINENADFRVNATNYEMYQPTYIKHLVN